MSVKYHFMFNNNIIKKMMHYEPFFNVDFETSQYELKQV